MKKYEIILKNTKVRGYLLSGWVIVFLSSLIQLFIAFSQSVNAQRIESLIGIAIVAFMLYIGRGDRFNFKDRDHSISIAYAVSMWIWLDWKLYMPALMLLVIYILYMLATRRFLVSINNRNIVYTTFPKRKIGWNELNNVLIKDGLLTIYFKNDKLLQNETEGDDNFNEKEFNEFCRQQLTKPE
jgi:hypothetical protein